MLISQWKILATSGLKSAFGVVPQAHALPSDNCDTLDIYSKGDEKYRNNGLGILLV